jgi:hypothetical protein
MSVQVIFLLLLLILFVVLFLVWKPWEIHQSGGNRASIFSRFHYLPDYDIQPSGGASGRLKFLGQKSRPYRFYTYKSGSWGTPWHVPEPIDHRCQRLSHRLCHGGDITSPCYDKVYQQCRQHINPIFIKTK